MSKLIITTVGTSVISNKLYSSEFESNISQLRDGTPCRVLGPTVITGLKTKKVSEDEDISETFKKAGLKNLKAEVDKLLNSQSYDDKYFNITGGFKATIPYITILAFDKGMTLRGLKLFMDIDEKINKALKELEIEKEGIYSDDFKCYPENNKEDFEKLKNYKLFLEIKNIQTNLWESYTKTKYYLKELALTDSAKSADVIFYEWLKICVNPQLDRSRLVVLKGFLISLIFSLLIVCIMGKHSVGNNFIGKGWNLWGQLMFSENIIFFASAALLIGIFIQVFWEEKTITEPL